MSCTVKRISTDPALPNLEDYVYMVEAISSNFNRENVKSVRDSEIFSYLSCELVSCLSRFDPKKGRFDKYLSSHLFNKAIDFLRSSKRERKHLPTTTEGCIEEVPQKTSSHIPTEILPQLLSSNDSGDLSILLDYYLGGKSVAELSNKHKVTRVAIYNRIKKCIKKIRETHSSLIEKSLEEL